MNFIAQYGKQYGTKKHADKKYEVFKQNYQKVKAHNKYESSLPFVMGMNQFADMTAEEFALLQGVEIPTVLQERTSHSFVKREDVHKHRHHHHKNQTTVPLQQAALNVSVNWYENGAVGEPKDQSSCGSCWAFTTAATLEALSVISGKFNSTPTFSMQQLIDCDTENDGCDGGWMYKGYTYTSKAGIMFYDDYPYKGHANQEKCLYNETRVAFKNGGMVQEKNLGNNELKALLNRQPVGVGIFTNNNFQFYKSGIMTEDFLECSSPDE